MNDIPPFVRHLLLCDDAEVNPHNRHKINIYGLLSVIRNQGEPPTFPLNHSFSVYAAVSGGRGRGHLQVVVAQADSASKIYESPNYDITFANDPLKVQGVVIHVHTCSFPRAGLYWVELWYNTSMIAHEAMEVK